MRVIDDIKEFIRIKVELTQVFLPKEKRLTKTELEFFVECIYFNYLGNDLTKFKELAPFILESGVLSKRDEVSQYKNKLSAKEWIQSGHGVFTLPKHLDIRPGNEGIMTISVTYEGNTEEELLEGQDNDVDNSGGSEEERNFGGTGYRDIRALVQ